MVLGQGKEAQVLDQTVMEEVSAVFHAYHSSCSSVGSPYLRQIRIPELSCIHFPLGRLGGAIPTLGWSAAACFSQRS